MWEKIKDFFRGPKQINRVLIAGLDPNFTAKLESDNRPNGHSCPECGHDITDRYANIILTSYPAQKEVECMNPECNYKGYRYIN